MQPVDTPPVDTPCVDTPQSRCRLGVARCDITPPVGIYHRMWGAATHERSTGVHRPLTATAVVFEMLDSAAAPGQTGRSGAAVQILIAVDHCLLIDREMQALLDSVAQKAGVSRETLLVVFSHTHAAGLMDSDRRHLPGGELIGDYLESLAEKLAGIVGEARAAVGPATIVYGYGRSALARHRDFRDDAGGGFVCGFNPGGQADDTVLVARATDEAGRLLATFVNYACHPTTLAWENTLISPDYPGAMREVVERAFPAPCVFLQGASGDLGPREGYTGGVSVADRNGRELGYAALAALEALPVAGTRFEYAGPIVSGATLGTWKHQPLPADRLAGHAHWRMARWTVELTYRPGLESAQSLRDEGARWQAKKGDAESIGDSAAARDCHAMIERIDRQLRRLASLPPGGEFPFPVALWQIGDALWLAVEAEHYQFLQCALRERFPAQPILVLTLANGSRPSYLPTADVYGTKTYPDTIALLARGSLERLIESIGERIAAWQNDPLERRTP